MQVDVGRSMDLAAYLDRQREWSLRTFGPGDRLARVLAHLRKEIAEVEADPTDLMEWIDIVMIALDGAWRAGHGAEAIARALADKLAINEAREWPDWRTADPNEPIEHKRLVEIEASIEEARDG